MGLEESKADMFGSEFQEIQQVESKDMLKPSAVVVYDVNGSIIDESVTQYSHIPKLNTTAPESIDRQIDYNQQQQQASKSSLLMPSTFLNCELDIEGGISESVEVPTFHYGTYLNHDNYDQNRQQTNIVYETRPKQKEEIH